ncbi:MAG: hypothetical protein HQK58_04215, partial [Deltaproteobacteria bacterium]|nr:hypothetical protein [Deltaproteobacteria bacterium]
MKIALLVDWMEDGRWPLYRALKAIGIQVSLIHTNSSRPSRSKALKVLQPLLSFWRVAVFAVVESREYHAVFSWSMRLAVYYGLLNRILLRKVRPRHIVRDFHLTLDRKIWSYRLRIALLRMAMPGIDYYMCTSRAEIQIYHDMFGFGRDRIRFYPDSAPQSYLDIGHLEETKDYVLSYGNSDRDFDTLVAAAEGIDKEIIILSQNYIPQRPLPGNVKLITKKVSEENLIELIRSARVVVLPMQGYRVAAGQNTMLET